jgi:hypothetical protein
MKARLIATTLAVTLLVIQVFGFANSQTSSGCRSDMKLIECVRHIADLAQSFDDRLKGVYDEITRRELPVGAVVTSVLTPEELLTGKNPQFDPSRWVPADGRALPANSLYQQLTGKAYAPDLRKFDSQKIVLNVVDGVADAGQVVDQLRTPEFSDANWTFHFGLRNIQGNRANNDYEQDVDNFEILVDNSRKLVAHGRTLNWKFNQWGAWQNGNTNFIGIATVPSPFRYYVKIN